MILNLLLLLICLAVLVKSAEYCTVYSSRIAKIFHVSEFIASFFILGIISVFPEAIISIISAIKNVPTFGLGALLGSNIADLTLVFGIVALFSSGGLRITSEILKKDFFYLLLIVFPLVLGLDGSYTRLEGIILIFSGLIFFLTLSVESNMFKKKFNTLKNPRFFKNLIFLFLSIGILLISANYTVKFGVEFAKEIQIPAILVSLTIVALSTCLPELVFSIKAIRKKHDGLVLGDVLGTVITDATIILGIVAVIQPFNFSVPFMYLTGGVMILSCLLIISFINSGKKLTKKEGIFLILFYILYLIVEFSLKNTA